jgi:uncharacterized protein YutE (UPF0331/DUF86 family)
MSFNTDLIRARCAEIEESVSRLEKFRSLSLDAFLSDRDALDVASYRLLIAIEASLALCYHVSAKRMRKVPEEYAACFGLLSEAGLLSEDLTKRLQQMARLRNLLVHVYWKIDYSRLYTVIRDDLGDLRAFAAAMAQLM